MFLKKEPAARPAPATRTVAVHLNMPGEPITGLPRELMRNSIALAKDYGGKRKWTMGYDNRVFTTTLTDEAIERLKADPRVHKVVETREKARISGAFPAKVDNTPPPQAKYTIPSSTPNPPYNHEAVNEDWGVTRLHPSFAWAKNNFGQGVKVCVIDSGISQGTFGWNALNPDTVPPETTRFGEGPGEKDHPAFWKDGVSVYKGGKDFRPGDYYPPQYNFANDDTCGHGTWCAGLIAEQGQFVGGYKGIAPGIELYVCKVLGISGDGDWADVAAGIDWARENGMDIISMSIGGGYNDPTVAAACAAAQAAGVLIFAAAGNSGPGADTIEYPAALNSVVAVAAADFYENVAPFSSRGAGVDLAGPGVEISGPMSEFWANMFVHSYPELIIYGSIDPDHPIFPWSEMQRNLYCCASGTSAACPLVAGAAALVKSWFPAASNAQIVQYLKDNARDI
jgi:subtilisin family serine protease